MRCTELSEMPVALAIARPVQWVAWCGGCVHVSATTRAVVSATIGALPGLRVLSRNRPSTCFGKALLPPPHRRPADPDALRHPLRRPAICRGEHDAHPLRVFARPVAIGHDRRQLLALRSIDNHTDRLSHGLFPPTWPSVAYPTAPVNPLNGSEH